MGEGQGGSEDAEGDGRIHVEAYEGEGSCQEEGEEGKEEVKEQITEEEWELIRGCGCHRSLKIVCDRIRENRGKSWGIGREDMEKLHKVVDQIAADNWRRYVLSK